MGENGSFLSKISIISSFICCFWLRGETFNYKIRTFFIQNWGETQYGNNAVSVFVILRGQYIVFLTFVAEFPFSSSDGAIWYRKNYFPFSLIPT